MEMLPIEKIARLGLLAFGLAAATRVGLPQSEDTGGQFRRFTADFGGLVTPSQGGYFKQGFNLRGGIGLLLSPQSKRYDATGVPQTDRHWSAYLNLNFMFNNAGLTSQAVTNAVQQNPLNPALLRAMSGTAQSYSLTLEPTFRYRFPRRCADPDDWRVTAYILAGAGGLKRTVSFNGGSGQGTLAQGPSLVGTGFGGTSGVYDVGFGLSLGPAKATEKLTWYAEIRRLQGLGINGADTLWPVSVGFRW